jgi:hypothetical protein
MEWQEWIEKKYLEWRGNSYGHDRTQEDFADYIGVSQSLMNQWMRPKKGKKTKKPTAQKTISRLVAKYGNEVYEVLGIPPPDDAEYQANLAAVPPEYKDLFEQDLKDFILKWLRDHGARID